MSTKQGLLLSIRAVIAQGEKSLGEGGCLYRGPNGLKCAIGHLIPDSTYTSCIEDKTLCLGNRVSDVFPNKYKSNSQWIELFNNVQTQHDNAWEDDFVVSFIDNIIKHVKRGNLPEYCLEALK